jgi:hypothetical protein
MSSNPQPEYAKDAVEDLVRKTSREVTEAAARNSQALELIGIPNNYMGFLTVSIVHTIRAMIKTEEFKQSDKAKEALTRGLHEITVQLIEDGVI